jgi:hypothetical protein
LDLRRWLFGDSLVTAALTVTPQQPMRIRVELALCLTDELAAAEAATAEEDTALAAEGADDMLALEPETAADDDRRAAADPVIFWRRDVQTESGIVAMRLPENDLRLSAFVVAPALITEDVEKRFRLHTAAGGDEAVPPTRIGIGVNVSGLTRLLDPSEIRREMALLASLGVNTVNAEPAVAGVFYAIRASAHGQTTFRNREYWGRPDSSLYDRAAGDLAQLRELLTQHYRELAANGKLAGTLTDPGNTWLLDLADEPGDPAPAASQQPAFRTFLQARGVTPSDVGGATWDEVMTSGYTPATARDRPEGPDLTMLTEDAAVAGETLEEPPAADDQANAEPQPASALDLPARRRYYYTRVFAAEQTATTFKEITQAVHTVFPGLHTSVNFRAGLRRVLLGETADWFTFGRRQAVTMMWNEDWLNTYGWRHNGIQLVSYYVELMRTAARKHALPVGGFLILMQDFADLKSYSALAHGSEFLHYWRYGPAYANYLPYSWSHNSRHLAAVSTVARDAARIDDALLDGTREPARVALVYAKSDPLWGRSQAENRLVYMALLHDQIPLDIITEAEIEEDGLLSRYSHLYLTDVSLRQKAAATIADWLRAGGRLWLSEDAGTRDEFDEPLAVLAALTGAGQTGTERTRGAAGAGQFERWLGLRPGATYEAPVRAKHNRQLGKGIIQSGWRDTDRARITGFALETGVQRPVQVDQAGVEVALFRHPREDVVLLINYTGVEPQPALTVRVQTGAATAESLRHGMLTATRDGEWLTVKLPLNRVDSLVLKH